VPARGRILVVDDEPALCLLYDELLRDEGYVVTTATNGAQALQRMDSFQPDLVLLDIRMPGMDGVELMGRMLNRRNDVPIVLNTAYSCYKDNFCTWVASAYVVKSSDSREMLATIDKVLAATRQLRPSHQAA